MTTKLDLKRKFPEYYKAPRKPILVDLPQAPFITFDGVGPPASENFQTAVGALYSVAYTLKFTCKYAGDDFAVPALEGFWWFASQKGPVETPQKVEDVPDEDWRWKAMIRLPDFVTEVQVKEAQTQVFEKKGLDPVMQVRFESLEEGLSVQMMHVGPYADEDATVGQILAFMEDNDLEHADRPGIGPHHEIYLSDPRRTAPEKLKTIVRIPVQHRK